MLGSPQMNYHNWNTMVPGRSGGSPGDVYNNSYNTQYQMPPAMAGYMSGPPPKPHPAAPPPQAPAMDWGSLFDKLGLGASGGPPEPVSPHVTSSIPLQSLYRKYLPASVVQTGVNQQFGRQMQGASPQPFLDQFGGGGTSARSGQFQPLVQAQMQDPLQQASMLTGDIPVQAMLQRRNFQTQGLQAQGNEVLGLANTANNWYGDRLHNWGQRQGVQSDIARMMMGGLRGR